MSNPAGPMAVAPCVPPIKKLFNILRKGGSFPTCAMGGSDSASAAHQFAIPGVNCPPQYTVWTLSGANDAYIPIACKFAGVITVQVEKNVTARVWWSLQGGTVSELINGNEAAAAQHIADLAAWQKARTEAANQQANPDTSASAVGRD